MNAERKSRWILAAVFVSLSTGCVSARMSDHVSDRLFKEGHYDEAADRLKAGLKEHGENHPDVLLYFLDIGLALHSAGKFSESNQYFLKADKIAEIKDYTSLAAEGATLLTSDNIKDYKGEDFEKVLINTYLAMNYSMLGNTEDALVEARRVNQKLYKMVTEGRRKYQQNAFARYLSAALYESERNWNDAYVDYKNTRSLNPDFRGIGIDLWRMAFATGNREDMEAWDREYQLSDADHTAAKQLISSRGPGEIIVLYENGISPIKRPNPSFSEVPKFYPRINPVYDARVSVRGGSVDQTVPTQILDNVEKTAMHNLDEKYGGMVAKKVAGVVAKEALSAGIGSATNSKLLGQVARMAFYLSDQADCRSWNLLPHDFEVARISVPAGSYDVVLQTNGGPTLPAKRVQVGAGKKIFVNFRYTP